MARTQADLLNLKSPAGARRLAVLAYVGLYIEVNAGRSPSEREITCALCLSSPSVTHNYLVVLQRSGYLSSTPRTARTLRLTTNGRDLLIQRCTAGELTTVGERFPCVRALAEAWRAAGSPSVYAIRGERAAVVVA